MTARWSSRPGPSIISARVISLTLTAALLLATCSQSGPEDSPSSAPTETLSLAPGDYSGVAWLPTDWLVVAHRADPRETGSVARLYRLRPDGSGFEQLPLGDDPTCRRTDYAVPTALPDGRLGFAKGCSGPAGPAEWSLWAYDLEAEQAQLLASVPRSPDWYSWRSNMEVAWFSAGSQICQGIAATGPGGDQQIPLRVGDGSASFTLAETFASTGAGDCVSVGWADQPAWSADDRVAFFASVEAAGIDGQARLDAPASLYLWFPEDDTAASRLSGIRAPRGLRWSPAGDQLAFSGHIDGAGDGTWLFRPGDQRLLMISPQSVAWLDWSPSEDELVGIVSLASDAGRQDRLVRMPLPEE